MTGTDEYQAELSTERHCAVPVPYDIESRNPMTHMTRTKMYILTAASALLYVFLTWAFADGLWTLGDGKFFLPENANGVTSISGSTVFTYLLFALIIVAGIWQASKIPAEGTEIAPVKSETPGQTDDPVLWKL